MEIDETRCKRQPVDADSSCANGVVKLAYAFNFTVHYAHIGDKSIAARTIINGSVFQDSVKGIILHTGTVPFA